VSFGGASLTICDADVSHPAVAKWQNKGVGTEATRWLVDYAFAQLGVHRIILGLFASNERALAVYKKWFVNGAGRQLRRRTDDDCSGFVQEGRRRKAVWQDGDWHDFLSMAILEEDWKEAKRTAS
jgi:RimJ/RimL family protein N-acetyltransferase